MSDTFNDAAAAEEGRLIRAANAARDDAREACRVAVNCATTASQAATKADNAARAAQLAASDAALAAIQATQAADNLRTQQ